MLVKLLAELDSQNMRYDHTNNHYDLDRPVVPSREERLEKLTRFHIMIHKSRATLISLSRQLGQLLITRHKYGHRVGRIPQIVAFELFICTTGFAPDPWTKVVDIEATLRSGGDSPDLMRLQEVHVIMRNWAALVCFASQLWHGRYAANNFPESVYGDRMSTDPRGTSTKPDTFDPRALSHVAKEALIRLPNLRSQFVEPTKKLAAYDPAGPDDAARTLAKMPRTRSVLGAPSATLTAKNRKRASPEPGVAPYEEVSNQDPALDDVWRNVP